MSVRDRAKEYEAFMSSSSSNSTGHAEERRKSREEPLESPGTTPKTSPSKKTPPPKPFPPPRRSKREGPQRLDSSPLQSKRVASETHSPQMTTKQTSSKKTANNDEKLDASPKKTVEDEKPKPKQPPPRPVPSKRHIASVAAMPYKKPDVTKASTLTRMRTSSRESDALNSATPPKRPPPAPNRTSSLPRKTRPPVPPKPVRGAHKRVGSPSFEARKSTTLPKTVSPTKERTSSATFPKVGLPSKEQFASENGFIHKDDDVVMASSETPPEVLSLNKCDDAETASYNDVIMATPVISKDNDDQIIEGVSKDVHHGKEPTKKGETFTDESITKLNGVSDDIRESHANDALATTELQTNIEYSKDLSITEKRTEFLDDVNAATKDDIDNNKRERSTLESTLDKESTDSENKLQRNIDISAMPEALQEIDSESGPAEHDIPMQSYTESKEGTDFHISTDDTSEVTEDDSKENLTLVVDDKVEVILTPEKQVTDSRSAGEEVCCLDSESPVDSHHHLGNWEISELSEEIDVMHIKRNTEDVTDERTHIQEEVEVSPFSQEEEQKPCILRKDEEDNTLELQVVSEVKVQRRVDLHEEDKILHIEVVSEVQVQQRVDLEEKTQELDAPSEVEVHQQVDLNEEETTLELELVSERRQDVAEVTEQSPEELDNVIDVGADQEQSQDVGIDQSAAQESVTVTTEDREEVEDETEILPSEEESKEADVLHEEILNETDELGVEITDAVTSEDRESSDKEVSPRIYENITLQHDGIEEEKANEEDSEAQIQESQQEINEPKSSGLYENITLEKEKIQENTQEDAEILDDEERSSPTYENVHLKKESVVENEANGEIVEDEEQDSTVPHPVRPARNKRKQKQQQNNEYENVSLADQKEDRMETDIPEENIAAQNSSPATELKVSSYENVELLPTSLNETQIEVKSLPTSPPRTPPPPRPAPRAQVSEILKSHTQEPELEYDVPKPRTSSSEINSEEVKEKRTPPPRPAPCTAKTSSEAATSLPTPDEQLYVTPSSLCIEARDETVFEDKQITEEPSSPRPSQQIIPPPRPAPYIRKTSAEPETSESLPSVDDEEQTYSVPSPLSRAPPDNTQSEDLTEKEKSPSSIRKHAPPPRPAPYDKQVSPPATTEETTIVIDEQIYVVPGSLVQRQPPNTEGAAVADYQTSEESRPKATQYENVELSTDMDSNIYSSPRTHSFTFASREGSEMPKRRTLSVGSSGKQETPEYVAPKARSTSIDEQVYAAPRSPSVCKREAVTDSEYRVPKASFKDESPEEEEPNTSTDVSQENVHQEDLYSVPSSRVPMEEPPQERLAQDHGSTETESPIIEDVYAVPMSPSPSTAEPITETGDMRDRTSSGEVYAVPSSPVSTKEDAFSSGQEDEEVYSAPKRSSVVVTSRSQLPSSFKKGAPPAKPPRSRGSIGSHDGSGARSDDEAEANKVEPTPRSNSITETSEDQPVAAPRRRSKQLQTELGEPNEEAPETASPKPKRPAPPRPRAPTTDKEKPRLPAPQRPPPPINRTSTVEVDQEPSSPLPVTGDSSDSESDVEAQPLPSPQPSGPPKKKTYHITREILSTERTFVKALGLVCEDCYGLIKEADVVPETTLNEIFKDLGNIYHLDSRFLQELEERMVTWDEHERIGDIIKKYGHFLKMYTTYINNYDKAANVLQETMKENLQFADLVLQFQASEKCRGLMLNSFMLKPVQRIPSYRLLLKDYLKHLSDDSVEYKDIKVALDIVSEVATLINESMKRVDNFEQVLRIQGSLVGHEEIVKPGREFIKQGSLMKLCRKDMQERMFFLLTDVLLYTVPVGATQYKMREMLPLLGMKVMLPESQDFENEFSIISTTRSFTLSASTSVERDEWLEDMTKAIEAVTLKKISFFKPKEGTVATPGTEEEAKLGAKAPVWIPDVRVTMCMLCTEKFTVTNRRHHCRGCGKVVCGSCSDNLAPLAYLDYAQARVCDLCYDVLLKEQNKEAVREEKDIIPPLPRLASDTESLDRINRKPAKFEILHRFKPGSKKPHQRKSKMFRPSVCTEVVGNESGSQVSGYLRCKRVSKHGWKRLWFVLKDNVLYTYKASEDVVAQETIPVLGYAVEELKKDGDEMVFQLKHAGMPSIIFKTDIESSALRWLLELKKATTL